MACQSGLSICNYDNMNTHALLVVFLARLALVAAGSAFGGVNHYYIANLPDAQRDQVVQQIVSANAKVIRTFVGARAYGMEKGNAIFTSPDVQSSLSNFSQLVPVLDRYDDLLYSIYKQSGGATKVILSLHNARNLGITLSDPFCDVFCQALHSRNLPWAQFYTDAQMRIDLKERYRQILTVYQSKNWPGKTWAQLSQVILAIDLENEPLVDDQASLFGDWICDIATYLKSAAINLQDVAVATGGIRGADFSDKPPATTGQNWPDDVFLCPAIDIISFHGYFTAKSKTSSGGADQPWYDLFISEALGGVLRPKALAHNKLLMAEEWAYSGPQSGLGARQTSEIQAQGHALNVRGIPWVYWDAMSGPDGYCDDDGCKEVSVDGQSGSPWAVLTGLMQEAWGSATEFDWSRYFPENPDAVFLPVPDNAQKVSPDGGDHPSDCTWGCKGWSCNAGSPCQGQLECSNSSTCVSCTWGCLAWDCDPNTPCKAIHQCNNGVCKAR